MNTQARQYPKDWHWDFWFTLPIYPYRQRRTLRTEVIPDTLWTFDQLQGIFYVVVPIRMSVVKLASGGLLVYSAVAPTPECVRLLRELEAIHGEVKYIILPTVSGLEHKVFIGPFARKFPQAQVFVAPQQWSYPVDLPLSWLGLPGRRTQILPADSNQTPFSNEFAYAIMKPIELGLGFFGEVAFYHRRSHTLLVTDAVLSIPDIAPPIIQLDPYPLLFHAKDRPGDKITDTVANRLKGWQRICLFALYFQPSTLGTPTLKVAWREAQAAPDRSPKAYFGLYPFQWQPNWLESFTALQDQGRLLVAPILQILILNRSPQAILEWVNHLASWDFQQIIPCHFTAPIAATPQDLLHAFSFLEPSLGQSLDKSAIDPTYNSLKAKDTNLLKEIDRALVKRGISPPIKS